MDEGVSFVLCIFCFEFHHIQETLSSHFISPPRIINLSSKKKKKVNGETYNFLTKRYLYDINIYLELYTQAT